jgi:hypothetical protein
VPGSAEEVEMSLLAGDEYASRFREGLEDGDGYEDEDEDGDGEVAQLEAAAGGDAEKTVPLTREDKKAMALLIVLCAFASAV